MSLGPWQIGLIALVVILLFGAGKLPRLMGDAAKGINAFKKNLKEDKSVIEDEKGLETDENFGVSDASKKKDKKAKS
ncbi:MAG: Sec-independent protein translocase protein TatA [Alphaproteobacteria bacterium MarineAlpha11_Bin1]|nr:MAG: Sec-independent protein translocase protein TatA [Alphaproteobacteria bacterium MarineAlpha11_Bin1]|tara:strand:+ start:267 stop:497 length:231 start_codon:yes stop_codon:yes gene_type:complete